MQLMNIHLPDVTVEVFKTNVEKDAEATHIIDLLLQHLPGRRITFDLHDCDKVLRVEGKNFDAQKVMRLVRGKGFQCSELE